MVSVVQTSLKDGRRAVLENDLRKYLMYTSGAICAQIIPFLSQEHQQQVVQAVERAKQVTMAELNAIIGQQQLQHLSHHAPGIPLTPHPSGLSLGAGSSGLLALTGALGVSAHLASKDERNHLDPEHLRGNQLSAAFCFFAQFSDEIVSSTLEATIKI
uniref:Groucho/TLE N-terminal Q-rich domain-containing protein n=1 Tax=Stegastes partitus TaxID=144197 RepID=A0A3B4Z852_9TELE